MKSYTPPSQCEQCVPIETPGDFTLELAHETTCPDRKDNK